MGAIANEELTSVAASQGVTGVSGVTDSALQTDEYSLLESNVTLSLVLVTIATLIIVFNGINIFAIARMSKLRNATGLLMMSLSAADLGVGISVLLPYLHMIVSQKLSSHMCNLIGFLNSSTLFVSIYNITFLSLDRCISIHKPLRYVSIVTPLRMKIVIATTWLLGCMVWILPIIGVGRYKFNEDEITCYFDVRSYPVYWISYMTITFLPSSIIIATSYIIIWRIACVHQNNDEMQLPPEAWNSRQQRIKANFTLVVIIGAYYITWMPYTIEHLVIAVTNVDVPESVEIFVYVLIVANSLWNPLIYVGTNTAFRTAAKKVVSVQCLGCKSGSVATEGYSGHSDSIIL